MRWTSRDGDGGAEYSPVLVDQAKEKETRPGLRGGSAAARAPQRTHRVGIFMIFRRTPLAGYLYPVRHGGGLRIK